MKTFFSALLLAVPALVSAEAEFTYGEAGIASVLGVDNVAAAAVASITIPQSKSILVGLSTEINLLTSTTVKGNNNKGSDTSTAEAGIVGYVKYLRESDYTTAAAACTDDSVPEALPGKVTFSSRKQELSVDVQLAIESATDQCSDCEIDGFVEIGLTLETTAAHHFNFIATDLEATGSNSNQYKVIACFELSEEETSENGSADAYVELQKRMMVLQEVLGYSNN